MKNKSILTTFCGGLIGILLAGYAYYFTEKQYPALVPIGVFLGCVIGYAIGHIRTLMGRVKTTAAIPLEWVRLQFDALPPLHFSGKKFRKNISASAFVAWSGIAWIPRAASRLVKFLYKKISTWLAVHPMNKVAIVEYMLAIGNIGLVYCLATHINPISQMKKSDSGNLNLLWMGVTLSYLVAAIYPFAKKIMRESDARWFYRDYSFYAAHGMVWYALRDILLNSITSALIAILFTVYWVSAFTVLIVLLALILVFCILAIIRDAFVGYVNTIREKSGITIFITTLIVTSISYLVFKAYFTDPVAIWGIALGTGTACAAVASFLITVTKGTAMEYLLFSADDALMKRCIERPAGKLLSFFGDTVVEPIGTNIAKMFYAL